LDKIVRQALFYVLPLSVFFLSLLLKISLKEGKNREKKQYCSMPIKMGPFWYLVFN